MPDLCPRYAGLVMDGIRIEPSPQWMQKRLEAAGMRPLNNIVDISNYVLLEMGHPLHAFDFDVLRQGKIVVARARQGEKMHTLDGIDRELDGEMLLINDGEGPVAIAGVMGGINSEISLSTKRVCCLNRPIFSLRPFAGLRENWDCLDRSELSIRAGSGLGKYRPGAGADLLSD